MRKSVIAAGVVNTAVCCAFCTPIAYSQAYPAKPIRMVVGFAPGGAPDFLARIIGQKLNESLGQTIVVDNRPGATGNIGAEIVAKAPPDGYTLLMGTVSLAISATLYGKLPFSVTKDFAPVSRVASVPLILVVHPAVPAKSVKDLIQLAKAKPGSFNYASVGNGSPQHLSGELFKTLGGVNMVHIPYKGGAPATAAVLGGEAQLFFAGMPPALPHVRSGRLRAVAVTTGKRSPAAPDVPTVIESGLAGFEVDNWHGIFATGGVPQAIVAKLHGELAKVLKMQDVRDRLLSEGAEPVTSTPDEFSVFLKSEVTKWADVVKASGAKAD
ncbi:MAG: tripartite tricarboxylate transporter substrate binding protein [Burkholderiales bacterium]